MLATVTKLAMLATVTTWPLFCLTISGRKAWVVYQWESKLTPKILFNCAGVVSRIVWEEPMPALLTRIDGWPRLDLTSSAALVTASGSVMSQRK